LHSSLQGLYEIAADLGMVPHGHLSHGEQHRAPSATAVLGMALHSLFLPHF
jgi:hypothetical protein